MGDIFDFVLNVVMYQTQPWDIRFYVIQYDILHKTPQYI